MSLFQSLLLKRADVEAKEKVQEPEPESKPEPEEKTVAALIPNIVFKLHMDRMALYMVEDTTLKTSPVFLFCLGVEVDAHVTLSWMWMCRCQ